MLVKQKDGSTEGRRVRRNGPRSSTQEEPGTIKSVKGEWILRLGGHPNYPSRRQTLPVNVEMKAGGE